MTDLERSEKIIIVILTAALLAGISIIAYHKCRPVGNLHVERSPAVPDTAVRALPRSAGKVNINEASAEALMSLKGVGRVLAERIVEYRAKNGYFISPDDLKKVPGIGDALFKKIRNEISLE